MAARSSRQIILDEVEGLTRLWREAQSALVRAASDPLFVVYTTGGPASIYNMEQRAAELMREVQGALADLRRSTAEWAPAVAKSLNEGSAAALDSAIAQGATGVVGGALGIANASSVRLLIEDLLTDTEFAIDSAVRTMRRHFRQTQQLAVTEAAINQNLVISEARLELSDVRAKRLAREFSKASADGKFILVNGRRYTMEYYADLVAKTRLSEAAATGAFNTALALGTDLVKISDHGKTDPKCDAHAGKVYSISGKTPGWPKLTVRPPYHPLCRHVMTPYVTEFKSDKELQFRKARSRGAVDPGVGMEEFFNAGSIA